MTPMLARLTLLALATAADLAVAQSAPQQGTHSAAYWRDVCTGRQVGVAHSEQYRTCLAYLSSFHDAADEYAEAGHRLFCPPEAISEETMRRDFLAYMEEIPGKGEFFPVGRILVLALARAYPCTGAR